MKFKDYYRLLDIAPNATDAEIKTAYRKLAKKYHPDTSKAVDAEERFKEINEAHETLKDPQKRAAFDQLRASGAKHGEEIDESRFGGFGGGFGGGTEGFSDVFDTLFGGQGHGRRQTRARRGSDIETQLQVNLELAHKGGVQRISLSGPNGQRSLEVKIPAGIPAGKVIRLTGQGGAGAGPGAPSGDLLLEIQHQAHPQFELIGENKKDVLFKLRLMPWEAAFGVQALVKTLDGDVTLSIPAGTNTGRKMRLKGRGFGPQPGDQLVQIEISNPELHTEAQRLAMQALANSFSKAS
jgi:curved DNA-binding protein